MPTILILDSAGNRTLAAALASDLEAQGFSAGTTTALSGARLRLGRLPRGSMRPAP